MPCAVVVVAVLAIWSWVTSTFCGVKKPSCERTPNHGTESRKKTIDEILFCFIIMRHFPVQLNVPIYTNISTKI